MVVLYIILGALVYLGIGGIVLGYQDAAEKHGIIVSPDEAMFYLFLWPLYFVYVGFVFLIQQPANLGSWIYKKFKKGE